MKNTVKTGEIYICKALVTKGKNKGTFRSRPVIVTQGPCEENGNVTEIAMIAQKKNGHKEDNPMIIGCECGLKSDSYVFADSVRTLGKEETLLGPVGELKDEEKLNRFLDLVKCEKMSRILKNRIYDSRNVICLCKKCREEFLEVPGLIVARADKKQSTMEECSYCSVGFGYAYHMLRVPTFIQ